MVSLLFIRREWACSKTYMHVARATPSLRCDTLKPCSRCSRNFHLQVKQLCLGLPFDVTSLDGNGLDEFMGRKEHPLARILRDLFCKDTVRFSFPHSSTLLGPASKFSVTLAAVLQQG